MLISQFATALTEIVISFQNNFQFVALFLAIFWAIHILNWLLGYRLCYLGIVPRTVSGLFGIFWTPFLHRDLNHLFFNSIPLFVLANFLLVYGKGTFYLISFLIITIGGFLVWLCAKRGVHIGASSLIMGYFGFLLTDAYTHVTATTIILAVIALYYFGGLIIALFPNAGRKDISWEGHVFGFVAGLATAYIMPFVLF